jgi:hypothetical protein
MSHIVRTCRTVSEDVEPRSLPSIPRGTYGIAPDDCDSGYPAVEFGPPWGVQRVGNHDLLDAGAVLGNAKRAIVYLKRPWRGVIRRTLKSFAGPYLKIAAARYLDEFSVEKHLCGKSRRDALALIDAAVALAEQKPDPSIKRCVKCGVAIEDAQLVGDERCDFCKDP